MRTVVNTEQEQAWNGYEGSHWARHHARWDAVNEGFDEPLLDAASIGARDRVLDVGCGAGRTARLAARRARLGRTVGLDLSEPMLARARDAAEGGERGPLDFRHGDAQVHPFEEAAFDAVISCYGVMFFADPLAAFTNIGRALRPGGRMAFICAAAPERNEWIEALGALRTELPLDGFGAPGAPGMFSLTDPGRIEVLLSGAGFTRVRVTRQETYGRWGTDAEDVADFLLGSGPGRHLTEQVEPAVEERAHRALSDALRVHEKDGAVRLRSSAWLVTAERPGSA